MKKYLLFLLPALLLLACNSNEKTPALKSISLNKKSIEIENGDSYRLIVLYEPEEAEDGAPNVIWESSNTKIATVDDNGKVKALKEGKTTITAYCGKLNAECEVTVVKATVQTLVVVPTSINSTESGGEYNLDINTLIAWTAKASDPWITLSATEGLGKKTIQVVVAANETFEETKGSIEVKSGEETRTIPVKRAARTAASLSFNPSIIELPVAGGSETVRVLCGIAWHAVMPEDSWVSITPQEGEGDGVIQVSVTEPNNSTPKTRELKIEFTNDQKKEYLTIRQAGREPKPIKIDPTSFNALATGSSKIVIVTSELDWTATSNKSWITLENKTSDNRINMIVAEYTPARGTDLQGQVVFSNGESEAILEVTQEEPYLTVDVDKIEASADGGTYNINIQSSVNWTASTDASWARIAIREGSGNINNTLVVDEADTQSTTSCTVTITGAGITKKVAVTRKGYDPNAFSISDSKKVYFSKGNLQYRATTNTWQFASSQYTYISSDNALASSTYSGWIDLFGWGTSGYNGCMPYNTDTDGRNYAPGSGWITTWFDRGEYDWGIHNKIGSDPAGTWRVLSRDEWKYLLKATSPGRKNGDNLYSIATVSGVTGLILLPDKWKQPSGTSFTPKASSFSTNTITNWSVWEQAGAIFLPAAGCRVGKTYSSGTGYYWTSSTTTDIKYTDDAAGELNFYSTGSVSANGRSERSKGYSVRLVREVP